MEDLDRLVDARLAHEDRLEAALECRVPLDVPRYSSSVVAPMTWSSPRARYGFSMFDASMAPSAAPAPITVCISSMKRIKPSAADTSSITVFNRSSNSPRYFVPAIIRRGRARPAIVGKRLGHLVVDDPLSDAFDDRRLPTPGSPKSAGLFFVRRERISIVWSISSARPITGSSFPSRASDVRSRPNSSSLGVCDVSFGAPPSTPRMTAPELRVGDAETLEQLPCLGIGVPRQCQQHVLGADIGRTELPRLLVRSQEGGLRIRRERWGDIGALAHLGLFLQLRRDRLRVGIDLLEHVPYDVVLERGVQEVVGVEVQAPHSSAV